MKKLLLFVLYLFIINPGITNAQQNFADITEKNIDSVVSISTLVDDDNSVALGSGFIIDKEGYIVTNSHVIDKAKTINVIKNDGKIYEAKIIGNDKKTDIALIKIESDENLKPVIFGDSDNIRVGEWILAIGNPFGLGSSVTAGIISAKSRDIDSGSYNDFIQTDASINQGNSGGPMFNMQGEVIGMNTSIFSTTGNSMGIGFATPSNNIIWIVEQLKNYGIVNRGWIGIKMQPNELEYINDEKSSIKKGILVLGITENSPAQKAGIVAGDIILKINDNIVDSPKNFSKIIYTSKVGEKIKLNIWNNGIISDKIINIELLKDQIKSDNKDQYKEQQQNYIPEIGYLYNDEKNQGLFILNIEKNSQAEKNNLQKGDIILKIDDYIINNVEDMKKHIKEVLYTGENKVVLTLLKNNEIKKVTIFLSE